MCRPQRRGSSEKIPRDRVSISKGRPSSRPPRIAGRVSDKGSAMPLRLHAVGAPQGATTLRNRRRPYMELLRSPAQPNKLLRLAPIPQYSPFKRPRTRHHGPLGRGSSERNGPGADNWTGRSRFLRSVENDPAIQLCPRQLIGRRARLCGSGHTGWGGPQRFPLLGKGPSTVRIFCPRPFAPIP